MTSLSQHHSLDAPSVNPRVNVQVAAADKVNLILRMPVPTRHRGRLEQEVTRHYLKSLSVMNKPAEDPGASANP
ncbi:hypothetical protein [uncultured Desulfosarcina sp.]|uniref:hypothetical protein n=1 Tax=uncultured Desulfosarcina sp. TaxID=218289 RepID=UPI0029C7ADEC|nr:hypothetical protein [uncultured Desulfosarcina sp.]